MSEQLYNIIFEGDILPGHQADAVKTRLAKIFGVHANQSHRIMSGKKHRIKSKVNKEGAKKYIYAMAKLGAMVYMDPIAAEVTEENSPAKASDAINSAFTQTGSFDVSAYRDFFNKQQQQLEEEPEKTDDGHTLLNLDDIDAAMNENKPSLDDVSGVNKILELQNITQKVLNQKSSSFNQSSANNKMDIDEIVKRRSSASPDADDTSGKQKLMDMRDAQRAAKKLRDSE